MKALNSVCRVLALVFAVGALVLFFTSFASITISNNEVVNITGAQLGFGGKITTEAAGEVSLAKSSDILFCLLLTAFTALLSGLAFKFKGSRIAAPIFGLFAGIYMLVISLSAPAKFVDTRPLSASAIAYEPMLFYATIAILLAGIIGTAFVFLTNYIEVKESKGNKKTIMQKVKSYLREFKSEIKKIVWPGPRSVVKNTIIVIVICLIIGAFIWLLDFGLTSLLNLVLGINK